ncbi:hypothetical protein [Saccharothrix sp. HUAS TT1]|uniref:hypothetical protein n=1 Tax=unclassified Saccharothrix TaxID=2593673 RepID=UPI00345B861F
MSRHHRAEATGHGDGFPATVVAADMQVEWARTAMNTAGHAVALAAQDLPLHEAWLRLEEMPPRFRAGTWRVLGRAEVAPRHGEVDLEPADTDKWIVVNGAGREAEARWRVEIEGARLLWWARRLVHRSPYVQNTRDEVEQLLALPAATLTAATARTATRAFVDEHWAAMNRVAHALTRDGRLSARQVHALTRPDAPEPT